MKAFKEIRAVGFRDWLWFVVYLRRDIFSYRLSVSYVGSTQRLNELVARRDRAKRIEEKLNSVK